MKVLAKLMLVLMLLVVFGSFQYDNGIGEAPFPNSWQTYFVGVGLFVGIILLTKEILVSLRPSWQK